MRLLCLPIVLALLSVTAQAQLKETIQSTTAQSILQGFKITGNKATRGQSTLTFDTAGGRVVGVLIEAPLSAYGDVARGVAAAWGEDAQSAANLAKTFAKATVQAQARKGFVDTTDEDGLDIIAVKLSGTGQAARWQVYVALNALPEQTFPETRNVTGAANAPSRIHILSDFQCPACLQLWQKVLPDWRKQPAQYRISYHHYPLSYHKNAPAAAEASECAAAQGKFWEYGDALFGNFKDWTPELDVIARRRFGQYAEQLKLNTATFKTCLDKHTYKSEVERQMKAAAPAFLTGTPTVYLNGIKLASYSRDEILSVQAMTQATPNAAQVILNRLKSLR